MIVCKPVRNRGRHRHVRARRKPGSEVLDLLAKALDVSPQYLMSEQLLELSDMEFRKRSGTSARDRIVVEAATIEELQRCCAPPPSSPAPSS